MASEKQILIPIIQGGLQTRVTLADFLVLTGISGGIAPPVATAAPIVSAGSAVGSVATYTPGTYSGSNIVTSIRWFVNGTPVTGLLAPGTGYTPVFSDRYGQLQVGEYTHNSVGEIINLSAAVGISYAGVIPPPPAPAPSPSPGPAPAPAPADTKPGIFLGAISSTSATIVAGRTDLAGSSNGGSTGGPAVFTTSTGQYVFFAIQSATVPTFHDNNTSFNGGFSDIGTPYVDGNGATWHIYKSDYPNAYPSAGSITLQ